MSKLIDRIWIFLAAKHMRNGDKKREKILQYNTEGVIIQKNIQYKGRKKAYRFDIHSQEGQDKNTPVIIDIHGGGLFYGNKEINTNFNCELVKRGFKVVSIDYPLIPKVSLYNQLKCIQEAFLYLKNNAKELKLNLDEVSLVGDSAGALLAYMSCALNSSKELQKGFSITGAELNITKLALISIMLDTQRSDFINKINTFILKKNENNLSCTNYLLNPRLLVNDFNFPRTYFLTSAQDFIQSDTLALQKLFEEKGLFSVFHNWDMGEEYELGHVFPVCYPLYKESIQEIDFMGEFFTKD